MAGPTFAAMRLQAGRRQQTPPGAARHEALSGEGGNQVSIGRMNCWRPCRVNA